MGLKVKSFVSSPADTARRDAVREAITQTNEAMVLVPTKLRAHAEAMVSALRQELSEKATHALVSVRLHRHTPEAEVIVAELCAAFAQHLMRELRDASDGTADRIVEAVRSRVAEAAHDRAAREE